MSMALPTSCLYLDTPLLVLRWYCIIRKVLRRYCIMRKNQLPNTLEILKKRNGTDYTIAREWFSIKRYPKKLQHIFINIFQNTENHNNAATSTILKSNQSTTTKIIGYTFSSCRNIFYIRHVGNNKYIASKK